MAAVVGGHGGGKPAMAQGGGDDASAIDKALSVARETLGIG
jgi:alanyl-tRNA synthetase